MPYTQNDLDKVNAAIMAIAAGERVVSVTINGETVQYQQTNRRELRELRSEIITELEASAPNQNNIFFTQTNKGL